MTNKDTLYYFEDEGYHYLSFYYGYNGREHTGWSLYLNGELKNGWEWGQSEPFDDGLPIGQRCILQWQ